jgi:hypothetical protein
MYVLTRQGEASLFIPRLVAPSSLLRTAHSLVDGRMPSHAINVGHPGHDFGAVTRRKRKTLALRRD